MNARPRGWTLPIRRWLFIALITLFIIPFAGLAITAASLLGAWDHDDASDAARMLTEGASQWTNPTWQTAVRDDLAGSGIDFILYSGGQEIYRSTPDPLAETNFSSDNGPPWADEGGARPVHGLTIEGTDPLLTAQVFDSMGDAPSAWWLIPLVGGILLLTTLGVLGWVVGKMLIRPLAATSRAATQVAAGDLDVSLPSSRVREVAEVNTAFEAMSAGLKESLEQQAALEQERRFFIGAVVHDLRTPLFSLRGYLEGMEKGVADTPEKQRRYIATAQEKANALDRLVNDLFDYTRLEYLGRPPEKEPLDLAELLRHQVEGLQEHARSRDLTLAFEPPAQPCTVEADPHLLARAVENLLDNALRYTPAGGAVHVTYGADARGVWFKVVDTGPGIPSEDLPHLFSPLYRGETSRNRSTGGIGLGLTITHRILLAHGGELHAANNPDGGAIFTAHLPGPGS